jgi:hypothetical protein
MVLISRMVEHNSFARRGLKQRKHNNVCSSWLLRLTEFIELHPPVLRSQCLLSCVITDLDSTNTHRMQLAAKLWTASWCSCDDATVRCLQLKCELPTAIHSYKLDRAAVVVDLSRTQSCCCCSCCCCSAAAAVVLLLLLALPPLHVLRCAQVSTLVLRLHCCVYCTASCNAAVQ